jgi:hypothetical protein
MLTEINEGHLYFPVKQPVEEVYDFTYIAKYVGYADTDLGQEITKKRLEFVEKLVPEGSKIVDVGVGSGDFMYKQDCLGYDVNPFMVKRLNNEGRYVDIYNKQDIEDENIKCLTFFDSFEHIKDPSMVLRNLPEQTIVIMSIPIWRYTGQYEGFPKKDIKEWKHYREDEHYHYFTTRGLCKYMLDNGFMVAQLSQFELDLGREDIFTFCFVKGV